MKMYLTIGFILCTFTFLSAQVGIGTITPDASSVLEVSSTKSGVLFPRLTSAQRNLIVNPAAGLLIYNTDKNLFEYNVGSSTSPKWVSLAIDQTQSGSFNVGVTNNGWNYYNVTFDKSYTSTPSIMLTFREGTGINNSGSHSVSHYKVANASPTGFTIAIYDTGSTLDVFMDWMAVPRTQ